MSEVSRTLRRILRRHLGGRRPGESSRSSLALPPEFVRVAADPDAHARASCRVLRATGRKGCFGPPEIARLRPCVRTVSRL